MSLLPKFLRIAAWILISAAVLTPGACAEEPKPAALPTDDDGVPRLTLDAPVIGTANSLQFTYARYYHTSNDPFTVYLDPCNGNPELYIKNNKNLPTVDSYSYLSINGRGVDSVQITEGPGEYSIGVYGGTASNFSLVVASKERIKVPMQTPAIRITSISTSKAEILWWPVTALEGSQDLEWDYFVYLLEERGEEQRQEPLLATTCGMERYGALKSHGFLVDRGPRKLYQGKIDFSNRHGTYSINVMAINKLHPLTKVAYSPIQFTATDFSTMKLETMYNGKVDKGQYAYLRVSTDFIVEDADNIKDNYYRQPEYKIMFSLTSRTGDADLFVSANRGPPTFDNYEYKSEGISEDYILLSIDDSITTFFVGVYGKEPSDFSIQAHFIDPADEPEPVSKHDKSNSSDSLLWTITKVIFEILGEILGAL